MHVLRARVVAGEDQVDTREVERAVGAAHERQQLLVVTGGSRDAIQIGGVHVAFCYRRGPRPGAVDRGVELRLREHVEQLQHHVLGAAGVREPLVHDRHAREALAQLLQEAHCSTSSHSWAGSHSRSPLRSAPARPAPGSPTRGACGQRSARPAVRARSILDRPPSPNAARPGSAAGRARCSSTLGSTSSSSPARP